MLKKRIIPCLDIRDGRTVKGVQFESIRDAGNPVELAAAYAQQGADELVFLDISASVERRKTLLPLVREIAATISIPFTVGGGISTLEGAREVMNAGADKISLNSAAVTNPTLIRTIAQQFGSQCVVVAIDTQLQNDEWVIATHGGRSFLDKKALDWALEAQEMGAGEILLTSMNGDGTKSGFSLDITSEIADALSIPVIASGGAGSAADFEVLFQSTKASAGLAASIFHFGEVTIPQLKKQLQAAGIPVRIPKK